MTHYVYQITNLINNKKYIGKHSGELDDSYFGSGDLIKEAISKYGKSNFRKDILYIAETEEEAYHKEEELIKFFNAVDSEEYYNISPGGEYKHKKVSPRDRSYCKTQEYREKMSEAVSGEKNGMYHKHHTEEAKRKMSINSKGKTTGEKNGMYGHSKDNAINGKWVEMYDENFNLIKTFKAKTAILDFLGIKGHTALDKAIKKQTLYHGYYWKQIDKKAVQDKSVETKINEDKTSF